MQVLRILVAAPHTLIRESLSVLLDQHSDWEVVGQAARSEEVYQLIEQLHPHVVVIDSALPSQGGAGTTKRIKQLFPQVKVLVLASSEDEVFARQHLNAGADGYLLKRTSTENLVGAIQGVVMGGVYIDAELSPLVTFMFDKSPVSMSAKSLSHQGHNVLRFVAQGLSNKEIGFLLCISIKTVETHKARSMRKLNLRTRAEIVSYALAQGWLQKDV